MKAYSIISLLLGIVNLPICLFFTIYGYIFPEALVGGTNLNKIGFIVGASAFGIMLLLLVLQQVILDETVVNLIYKLNIFEKAVIVILCIHVAYRFLFAEKVSWENDSSITYSKVMTSFAMANVINFAAIVTSINYLKLK